MTKKTWKKLLKELQELGNSQVPWLLASKRNSYALTLCWYQHQQNLQMQNVSWCGTLLSWLFQIANQTLERIPEKMSIHRWWRVMIRSQTILSSDCQIAQVTNQSLLTLSPGNQEMATCFAACGNGFQLLIDWDCSMKVHLLLRLKSHSDREDQERPAY